MPTVVNRCFLFSLLISGNIYHVSIESNLSCEIWTKFSTQACVFCVL
jgi:hypothetical protein